MAAVKEVQVVKTTTKEFPYGGQCSGMYLVAVGVFFTDHTAHMRMSLVKNVADVPDFDVSQILSSTLFEKEQAAWRTAVSNTNDSHQMQVEEQYQVLFRSESAVNTTETLRVLSIGLFTDLLLQ